MRVGFVGTGKHLTNEQLVEVHMLLGDLQSGGATQATHGMNPGADEQFHDQAKGFGYFTIRGEVKQSAKCECDLVMPVKPFLDRNANIVQESDVVIVTPKESEERTTDVGWSSTWMTVQYARKAKKPLVILWPDGTGIVEHVEGIQTPQAYRQSVTGR